MTRHRPLEPFQPSQQFQRTERKTNPRQRESNMPTTRLCNHILPLCSRRAMLQSLSCGFGWLAFSDLGAALNGGRRSDDSLCPTAKTCHLFVHARRPFTCRYSGLQAEANC